MLFVCSCISQVSHKHITFLQSFSPDVMHYKLYVSEAPVAVTSKSRSFVIKDGLNTGKFDELTSRMSVDLTELLNKGEYFIGVTSVGNNKEESEMIVLDRITVIK